LQFKQVFCGLEQLFSPSPAASYGHI